MIRKTLFFLAICGMQLSGCSGAATPPVYNCGSVNYGNDFLECIQICRKMDPACNPSTFLPATTRCEQMCMDHYGVAGATPSS